MSSREYVYESRGDKSSKLFGLSYITVRTTRRQSSGMSIAQQKQYAARVEYGKDRCLQPGQSTYAQCRFCFPWKKQPIKYKAM
ncbi:hypothetical protein ANO11243_040040 [Dothideomycetidae sp. 11243]|nr:hypothetical protein ANO11243_040040 [fungal sp. No.11243]